MNATFLKISFADSPIAPRPRGTPGLIAVPSAARSRADSSGAHGTETGYAGRRTSREDSVSVHRDGVINSISAKP